MTSGCFDIDHARVDVPMVEALKCIDKEMCASACRSCPRYSTSWSCPPFDRYDFAGLHPDRFNTLSLIVTRFVSHEKMPLETARRLFNEEMRKFMPWIRSEAKAKGGVVYGFAGSCDLCTSPCTRNENKPCLHPDIAGPSLEAAGFDVGKLLERYCKMELSWSYDGFAPQTMTYVSAIAY